MCQPLSHVRLFVTPQTAAHQASFSWNSPSKNTGVDCHSLLHRVFLEQLYCLRLSPNFKAHSQNTHPLISAYITLAKTRQCCCLLQIRMVNVVAFFKFQFPVQAAVSPSITKLESWKQESNDCQVGDQETLHQHPCLQTCQGYHGSDCQIDFLSCAQKSS